VVGREFLGGEAGKKGYFVMTDDWFDRYVQVIVVQRKYIPAPLLSVFAPSPRPCRRGTDDEGLATSSLK